MPTLSERIEAATRQHAAVLAGILASSTMEEVVAFTRAAALVMAPVPLPAPPAAPPEPPRPDTIDPQGLVLNVLRYLSARGGADKVYSVAKALCPKLMTVRFFSRLITAYQWKGDGVIERAKRGIFMHYEMTSAGRNMLAMYDHQHEPPTTAPKADTVSKEQTTLGPAEVRSLLKETKGARDRGEILHAWDREFISAYLQEIGLGLPGQEAAGVAFHATEQSEGPRPAGIQYGAEVDDIKDRVGSALEGIPDPGLSLGEVVRKTGRFINAIDMRELNRQGIVCIRNVQGSDYYSLAPKAEEKQGEGVTRQRFEKVVAWLKDHPWSSREEISRGTGVTSRQISYLEADKPMNACREWKKVVEFSRARSKLGQMVKVYALRGAEPQRQKRGRKAKPDNGRFSEALAWLSMNPGSTLRQIAEGIGMSYVDFKNMLNNSKYKERWKVRVEVVGAVDRSTRGRPASLYRVKA